MTQPYDPRADWAREDREAAARVNYVHPTRPRPAHLITPDADGVIRLRAGESITLR